MKKMQPYVKQWYDFLDQDRFMGLKCKRCGSVEFPPVPVCAQCSSTDLEWHEISGEGELITFSLCTMPDPVVAAYGHHLQGVIKLQEGPSFHSMVVDVDPTDTAGLFAKIPCKVKAINQQRDGYRWPVFKIVE